MFDPKTITQDRTPPAPREREQGVGHADTGIRQQASEPGICASCNKPFQAGDDIVSNWRNTGATGVVEDYRHAACWSKWESFRNSAPGRSNKPVL